MTLSTANSEGTPDTETEVEAAPAQSRPVPTHDRRRAPRLGRDAVPGIGSVTLYPRDPAKLLNISATGLLVSCSRRLLPDSSAKFVLRSSDQDLIVTGRVVRSQVVAISGERGVAYETAIHTDAEVDLQRYGAAELPELESNRRVHERIVGPFDGTCVTPNGETPIRVSDISDGGCFVAQANSVAPGDRLDMQIELPNGDPFVAAAEVLSADPRQGFAVHFLNQDAVPEASRAGALEPTGHTGHEGSRPWLLANDW